MQTKFGYSQTSFYDDITNPLNGVNTEFSVKLYNDLLKVTGVDGELEGGITKGMVDANGDGSISQQEAMTSDNYKILTANLLGLTDPKTSKEFFKQYAVKNYQDSFEYGYSKKPPVEGGGEDEGGLFFTPNTYVKLGPDRESFTSAYAEGLLMDIKAGKPIQFYGSLYTFEDGNWYEQVGDDKGGFSEEKSLIGNNENLAKNVFNTPDRRFVDAKTTKVKKVDPKTGVEEKESESASEIRQLQDVFAKTEDLAINDLKKILPDGYSFRETDESIGDEGFGTYIPFTDAIEIYDDGNPPKSLGVYSFDYDNPVKANAEAKRFFNQFKDVLKFKKLK
jgi:hypothetical protein